MDWQQRQTIFNKFRTQQSSGPASCHGSLNSPFFNQGVVNPHLPVAVYPPAYSGRWRSNARTSIPRVDSTSRRNRSTPGPSGGVFQKSIFTRFINFWRYFPTQTRKWLQERGRDTPTKGLVWSPGDPFSWNENGQWQLLHNRFIITNKKFVCSNFHWTTPGGETGPTIFPHSGMRPAFSRSQRYLR